MESKGTLLQKSWMSTSPLQPNQNGVDPLVRLVNSPTNCSTELRLDKSKFKVLIKGKLFMRIFQFWTPPRSSNSKLYFISNQSLSN